MLDREQIDLIVKELIKSGYVLTGLTSGLHEIIDQIAITLKYINPSQSDRMESGIDLEEEDYLKVKDRIWKLVLEGKLAPNLLPNLHFTENGQKFKEKLIKEEDK